MRWARTLGVGAIVQKLGADANVQPYVDESEKWYRERAAEVASLVGAGVASAGVCSILRTAAMQRAFSTWLFECGMTQPFAWTRSEGDKPAINPRLDLVQMASRLGDSSRQNLLAAHELAAREAAARPKPSPWYAHALPTTSSAPKADDESDDDDAPTLTVDAEPSAPSSRDVDLQRADDEHEEQTPQATTTPATLARPSGPTWLPLCLHPHAQLYRGIESYHPMARHGAIRALTEKLVHMGRLGGEGEARAVFDGVVAWLAANPLPPT